MKLSSDQLQQLYTFTEKHFVEWYDVQTELVDHLANGIEEQWQNNESLTFDDALKNEFKKFGIMGFSEVVEQKTNALNKYYRKQVWKHFTAYFKLPKIILTLAIIWCLYKMLSIVENKIVVILPIALVLFSTFILYLIKSGRRIKQKKKETGKKWLFDNVILQLGGLMHFLNVGTYSSILFQDSLWNSLITFSFTVIIVLYALVLFVSVSIAPKVKETLSKEHPDYNLA